ncbi:hypothetical protein TNCV_76461 [Trichonephila clavipes]|nr:hypothetical protein TNCV_76461 [Trichonephila clavipes]
MHVIAKTGSNIPQVIRSNRLRWLGHIWRSPENNQTRAYTFKNPKGSRTRGRPPTRNEKVSNHGSIPITIDCNVVAFIVFEEGFHQPIKRTKQSVFLDVTVFRHTLVD